MYKNKARIKSPAFHPKRGELLFIYLFYSPLRSALCTAGAISAALIWSPATFLCLAKISVGTRILTVIVTMAANYKLALRYLVLIGKMLHESEYAWGHTSGSIHSCTTRSVWAKCFVFMRRQEARSLYQGICLFLKIWTEVLFWQHTRQSVFIDCCHFLRQKWAQVKSQICWESCFIRL